MTNESRKWARRSPEQWQRLLRRQADSGQSVDTFCRAEAVSKASFYRWRRELAGTASEPVPLPAGDGAPAFLDLSQLAGVAGAGTVGGDPGAAGWELELSLGSGVVLRLRGH